MAKRKIIWHSPAHKSFTKTIAWYLTNCGVSFAETYSDNILSTLDVLSLMPSIGVTKKIVSQRHYCEYVTHPKTIIRYWHNDTQLHVIDIVSTRMDR